MSPPKIKRKVTRPNFKKISRESSKCFKCQLTAYTCDEKRPCGACTLHQHFCAYSPEANRRYAESVLLQFEAESGPVFDDTNEPEKSAVTEVDTLRKTMAEGVRMLLAWRDNTPEDKYTPPSRAASIAQLMAIYVPALSLSSSSQSAASMDFVLTPGADLKLETALGLAAEALETADEPKDCMACIRCQIMEVSYECDLDGPCHRCVQDNGQCYYAGELAVDIFGIEESNPEA